MTEPGPGAPYTTGQRVAVFSSGIWRIEGLREFLSAAELRYRPRPSQGAAVDSVVGWGTKPTSRAAAQFAARAKKPLVRLEDGFFRSVRTGRTDPPLSLVIDDLGIYYDASRPSRLEAILNASGEADALSDPNLIERARRARAQVRAAGLSKYNDAPVGLPAWFEELSSPIVLVVDQTYGDEAVRRGNLDASGFERMLAAAEEEHPEATIVVKVHPEVAQGRKRGYLAQAAMQSPRVRILATHANPLLVLDRVTHVYVGTSQLGFEAALLGKKVTCFGTPFYSGWGLTDDRLPVPRRARARSVDELAAAAWILYPRYRHPVRAEPCELEDVLDHLALQRSRFEQNAGTVRAYGFSWWKRPFVRPYLGGPSTRLHFERRLDAAKLTPGQTTRAVAWGRRGPPSLEATCSAQGVPLARMEDGFLRSIGLGADLTAPASLVLDGSGMYFDPSRPSDLETLLESRSFSEDELLQAQRLRQRITSEGLSKYNLAGKRELDPLPRTRALGRPIFLVPGQVDDDASVVSGGAGLFSNDAFLAAVRAAHPSAYLVYKPHPDVVSGNRKGALSRAARALVDQVVVGVDLARCLSACDEVHVLTSLVGFEALLRGLSVSVYGQPFYSGWGLTRDRVPVARRTRRLALDELVAGALLVYPRYYSFGAKAFVTAEDIVFELVRDRETGGAGSRASIPLEASWPLRQLRKVWGWGREVRRAR